MNIDKQLDIAKQILLNDNAALIAIENNLENKVIDKLHKTLNN